MIFLQISGQYLLKQLLKGKNELVISLLYNTKRQTGEEIFTVKANTIYIENIV